MSFAPADRPRVSLSPEFRELRRIHLGSATQVYRAIRAADGLPVVLKTSAESRPSSAQLQSMEREYQIHRSVVGAEHVTQAYDLVAAEHRYLLVLEDTGGRSVRDLLGGGRPPLRQAVSFAIDVLLGLEELHRQQIVHRDINPSNLIAEPAAGRLKLADLSLATRLPQEVGEIGTPESLHGTLPYMSPEQTGRMNRPVDHRSDLYSLGVTLYEWLTGALPFEASDPLGWVHQHIACAPRPPHERAEIPPALSAITLKLLAKSAEDRYQGAAGALHDLRRVQSELSEGGGWSDRLGPSFRPGAQDIQEQFRLPRRFYGRAAELARLERAFDDACAGGRSVCLISGPVGIGKTALVGELIRPLTQRGGFFLRGKFDQYDHHEVYGAVLGALRQWLAVVLSRESAEIERWRARIEQQLGERASLLAEMLPELGRWLGRPAAVEPVSGEGRWLGRPAAVEPVSGEIARLRLQLALDHLLRVIAHPDHPLILVLDDVQWADPASLELLEVVLLDPEPRAMLLLLVSRDGEERDIRLWLGHLRGRVPFEEISLGPLSGPELERWLSETMPSTLRPVEPLARWVQTKTEGNPFFVREFLKTLHTEGHLRFDRERRSWDWEQSAIEQSAITTNVVELLLSRLQVLPASAREVLPLAACLGHRFDLGTLGLLGHRLIPELARALWPAIQAGLIQPVGETGGWERFGEAAVPALSGAGSDGGPPLLAQFVHDRVQQAAYALIPEPERPEVHRRIGTTLLRRLPPEELDRQLFHVARHLQLGRDLLTEGSERREAAALHIAAGQKAQAGAAFADASANFRQALALLPAARWAAEPALASAACLGTIACGYALGDVDTVMALGDEMLRNVSPGPDRQQVYRIQIHALSAARRHPEAIDVGIVALEKLGVEFPRVVSKVRLGWEVLTAWLAARRMLARGALPPMTDPTALAQNEVMTAILPSIYLSAPELAVVLMCRQIALMQRAGIGPHRELALAYAGALLAGAMGRVEEGLRLSDRVMAAPGAVHAQNRCAYIMTGFLDYWRQPNGELLERFRKIHLQSVEAGDLLYASFALMSYGINTPFFGEDLRQTQALKLYAAFRERFAGKSSLDSIAFYEHLLRCEVRVYRQIPEDRSACLGPEWIEAPFAEGAPQPADATARFVGLMTRGLLHLVFGHFGPAFEAFEQMVAHADATSGFFNRVAGLYVMRPLAALGGWDSVGAAERRRRMRLAKGALRTLRRLARWEEAGGSGLLVAEWHLVEAERLRALGRLRDALSHYGRAVDIARRRRQSWVVGVACERAAACCRAEGQLTLEAHFVQEAAYTYERWGGLVKVAQLEQLHPELLTARRSEGATDGQSAQLPADHLDPISAVKTSQALSGELSLEPLLSKLMQAVCENAGAQRAFLFLVDVPGPDALPRLAAGHGWVGAPLPSGRSPEVAPFSLARFVLRTGRTLSVPDARSGDDPLLDDPYLQRCRPRAVLVVPIERQKERLGVLYLEHTETPGVFTERHREFLKLLIGQIAISLTNARLYAELQEARLAAETARRAAETASEAKSFFLAKMSHELRTPLNAILGYTEIVGEELADARLSLVDEELDRIRLAGRNLSQLVGNILDLTRIESGRLEVHAEPFSPVAFVEELRASVAPEFRSSTNRLVVESHDLPSQVIADRQKLQQLLSNLLTNANKYTRQGTVTLTSALEGDQLRFEVADTGVGIAPEQHELIFRAFTQVDNSYTREFDGAGLGLAICRELCAALGGSLTLDSALGRGARFVVRIPVSPRPETA